MLGHRPDRHQLVGRVLVRCGLLFAAIIAGYGIGGCAQAYAHAKHFNGHVGMVVGRAEPRRPPLLPLYWVRFGPRNGHTGGENRFYGHQADKSGNQPNCCGIGTSWLPFDIARWNVHELLHLGADTAVTVTACVSFGGLAAAETPSLFADTWAAALSAAACEHGAVQLHAEYDRVELNPRG